MAREIKFRSWDGEKIINVNDIIFSGKVPKAFWRENSITEWSETIMQYTGLKDRNNKEIYEGDIIKWGDLITSNELMLRIATVKIDPDIQFHRINRNSKDIFHWATFAYGNNQLKVIGNIYENPEILKLYNATT